MANQLSFERDSTKDVWAQVLTHYKNRPLLAHLAAWLLIGVAFGITMLPNFSVGSMIGFGISGIVFGILLSLVTYPFSGHYSYTIAGALIGAAFIPILSMTGMCGPIGSQGASVCLLVGALIGGTSTIWQAPFTILRWIRKSIAPDGIDR